MTVETPQPAFAGVLEKAPLERYVPPAKPSLVGLARAELAQALGVIGVPERQRKMRAQQIWHWLYVRGATRFAEMSSVSKELHALLDAHFTLARPEVVAEQISPGVRLRTRRCVPVWQNEQLSVQPTWLDSAS